MSQFFNQAQMKQKLFGSLGVSGTMKFKIVWNADPTIHGFYIMSYTPPAVSVSPYPNTYMKFAMFHSGCPHVKINISKDTSAELSVPYIGETPYIPLLWENNWISAKQVGYLNLIPIVGPESSTFPISVSYSIYFAIEDAKTFGESGLLPSVQMASMFGQAAGQVAEAIKKSKIVSSTAGKISDNLLANDNNNVGGWLSRTAGWLAGGASKVLDLFGWSKPTSVLPVQPVASLPMMDVMTADQTFTGVKFSNNLDAEVKPIDLDGNGKDMMIIKNMMRDEIVPFEAFHGILRMTKTQPVGTLLGYYDYNYRSWYQSATDPYNPAVTWNAMNHYGFLSRIFRFWRGSHILSLHMVATKFHSGRIRMIYSPLSVSGDRQAEMYDNMSYTYSWVIDISDPTTWQVTVPFVSLNPWKKSDESAGRIYFYVENVLIAPDNVAQGIYIIGSAMPGTDLEFATPSLASYGEETHTPWQIYYQPPTLDEPINNTLNLVPDKLPTVEGTIEFTHDAINSTDAHQASVGDPVRSLRSVIKRFWNAGFCNKNLRYITLSNIPFLRSSSRFQDNRIEADMLAFIASNYVFSRGGMRWAAQNYLPARVTPITSVPTSQMTGANGVEFSNNNNYMNHRSQTLGLGAVDPLKVDLPYYSESMCINHWKHESNRVLQSLRVDYFAGTMDETTILRAGADDYQLGFLIGAPTLVTSVIN